MNKKPKSQQNENQKYSQATQNETHIKDVVDKITLSTHLLDACNSNYIVNVMLWIWPKK